MLDAATCFFMSMNELKRNISTVTPFVQRHFFVDGRFKDFDYPSPLSIDGSRELIMSYDNTILIDAPDLKEIDKRQIYLDKTKEHNIELLLVLDSDEYVELDPGMTWEKFEEYCRFEYEVYNKMTTQFGIYVENANTPGKNQFDPRPRIFANPWDIKHTSHRRFVTKSDNRKIKEPSSIIAGLRLRHNYSLRHETYNELRLAYQKKLIHDEIRDEEH